ncbi:tandem-95 repeat protein [Mycolicibacterium duvalii]|uniref:Ig-like domain-containing protein n=1 Tax=Mycolicibacterium duvalii TaxID=39688 RepID=UPI0013D89F7A|nr:Ig-like domain-containing protein [Mycolicibacterium duvalii]MCV7367111.1 tandem-95 repeat protein [Mycolicibacterium duvalii]
MNFIGPSANALLKALQMLPSENLRAHLSRVDSVASCSICQQLTTEGHNFRGALAVGYAKYVGRVGALAVALGIGTAVANPAWADTQTNDTETSSTGVADARSRASAGPDRRAGSPGPTALSEPTASSEPARLTTGIDADDIDAGDDVEEAVDEPELTIDDEESGDNVAEDTSALEPGPVNEEDEADERRAGRTLVGDAPATANISDRSSSVTLPADRTRRPAASGPERAETTSSSEISPADDGAGSTGIMEFRILTEQSSPSTHRPRTPDNPGTETRDVPAPAPLVRQPKTPLGAILGGPAAMLDIAVKAINMLFSPAPTMPGDPPLLLGVLAFVRREVTRTFFNSSPHAVGDVASTSESIPTRIAVLDNDTDRGAGDVLTVTEYTQATNGVVSLNNDGSFTYTPHAGYVGTDTFTYRVSDEASPWHVHSLASLLKGGHGSTATVTVTVNPIENQTPSAGDDSTTTAEDTPTVIDVLANDTDPDGDTLTISTVGTPSHGTAVVADGKITYTPATDYHGDDTFTYTVSDGTATDTATVAVTITPTNDAPVAAADTASTAEDTPTVIDVLANDTDPDGDTHTISKVSTPGHGTAVVTDGKITYTPDANYHGDDTFTYTVTDSTAANTATVTVTVTPANDAPVASDDTFTMPADATSATFNVLANDTDPDRDSLSVVAVTGAINGTATFSGGTVTYTPATGFTGTEVLTYTVSDGRLTDTATLTVIVPVYNATPVAGTPAYDFTTNSGSGTVTGTINVSDPDGDTLTFELTARPVEEVGMVAIDSETGSWEFIPTAQARLGAWLGTGESSATFSVTVSDGQATTTINVVAPIDAAVTFTRDVFDIDAERLEAQGLAISPDGRLYLTQYLADDSAGQVTVIGRGGSVDAVIDIASVIPQAISTAYDVAVGPDGRVYVSSEVGDSWEDYVQESFHGAVLVIDPASDYSVALFAELAEPASGIDVDSAGRVYVGSWTTKTITVLNPDGSNADVIHLPEPADAATGVTGVAVGPTDRMYVTDPWQGTVTVVERDGSIAHTIDLGGTPWSVEVGGNGAVYVSDPDTGTLTVLNQDGSIAAVANLGSDSYPADVTLGADGRVYVPLTATGDDGALGRIIVLTPVAVARLLGATVIGEPIAGTPGSVDGSIYSSPVVTADGTIYQTVSTRDSAGVATVTVTVIAPSGTTTHTEPVSGDPAGPLVMGENGTAYQTITHRDSDTDATVTGVIIMPPAGQSWFTGHHVGAPAGPVVLGADGTGYQTLSQLMSDGTYTTTVLVITSDGATPYTLNGFPGSSGIGAPSGPVVAPDGTVYLTVGDWVIDPNTLQAGEHTTTVAILGPNGPSTSSIDGAAGGGVGLASDGSVYQPIYQTPTRPDATLGTAVLAVLTDNGLVQLGGTVDGIPIGSPVIGPDGTLYQTVFSPVFDADAGTVEYVTAVAVITPTGLTSILSDIAGIPLRASDGSSVLPVVVGPDGTAYQVAQNLDPATYTTSTTLAVLTATGDTDITDIAGEAVGPVVPGVDGRAFLTTYDAETDTTRVAVITANGTTIRELAGRPGDSQLTAMNWSVVVAPDGTAYQTTSAVDPDSGVNTTKVSVISETGIVTHTIDGSPAGSVVFAPDGTVYQSVGRIDPYSGDSSTTVSVISPMGITPITHPITGTPAGSVMFGPRGSIYQVTVETNGGMIDATSRVFVIGGAATATTAYAAGGAPENLAATAWDAPALMTVEAMVTAPASAPATVAAQSALAGGVQGVAISAANIESTLLRAVAPIATISTSAVFPYAGQVAVSPDGVHVYTVSISGTGSTVQQAISIVNTRTNTVKTIPVGNGYPYNAYGIAVSPDGRSVYTNGLTFTGISYQPAAFILDTVTHTVRTIPISGAYFNEVGIAVSPDGRHVYYSGVTGNAGGTHQQVLTVLDTTSNTVSTIPVPNQNSSDTPYFVHGVVVSPDSQRVYTTRVTPNGSVAVTVLDTATNTVSSIPVNGPLFARGLALSPDGRSAYTVGVNSDGTTAITVLNTSTKTITTIPVPVPVPYLYGNPYAYAVTVSPDGRRVYANTGNGGVIVFDAITKDVTIVPINVAGVDPQTGGIAISPDGHRMYITSGDLDYGSNGQEAVLVLDTAKINSVATKFIAMQALQEALSRLIPSTGDYQVEKKVETEEMRASNLLGRIPDSNETREAIKIQIIDTDPDDGEVTPETTRMVVYLSGMLGKANPFAKLASSAGAVAVANGQIPHEVADEIDKFWQKYKPAEIMLVGYSKGGMIAQNYAEQGRHSRRVRALVTFASPIVQPPNFDYPAIHLRDVFDSIPRWLDQPQDKQENSEVARTYDWIGSGKHETKNYTDGAHWFEINGGRVLIKNAMAEFEGTEIYNFVRYY